jgi:hypothetical protein
MDKFGLDKSQQFTYKHYEINGKIYYVPYYSQYTNNNIPKLLDNSEKLSYTMKTIIVDGKEYYVPYHWIDCEQTRNSIRRSKL